MIAIETRILPPTEKRGARVVATTVNGHRFTCAYNDSLRNDENHWYAARALADLQRWDFPMIQGSTKTGYVHVFTK